MKKSELRKVFSKKFPSSGAFQEFKFGIRFAGRSISKLLRNRIVVFEGLEKNCPDDSAVIYNSVLAVLYDLERLVADTCGKVKNAD